MPARHVEDRKQNQLVKLAPPLAAATVCDVAGLLPRHPVQLAPQCGLAVIAPPCAAFSRQGSIRQGAGQPGEPPQHIWAGVPRTGQGAQSRGGAAQETGEPARQRAQQTGRGLRRAGERSGRTRTWVAYLRALTGMYVVSTLKAMNQALSRVHASWAATMPYRKYQALL